MIINSTSYQHGTLDLRTWLEDTHVTEFKARQRSREDINEIVVHEPAIGSWASTQRALDRRGLGCHFMVDHDGRVSQHGDVVDRMAHAADHNAPSVGIEVINPYEPHKREPDGPWQGVINAPWAHGGRYVLPTPQQCYALAVLIGELLVNEALSIPSVWPGLVDGKWQLAKMRGAPKTPKQVARTPGIWSHQQVGNHSDGGFPLLYAWMRLEAGLGPLDAYNETRSRCTGVRREADVLGLV